MNEKTTLEAVLKHFYSLHGNVWGIRKEYYTDTYFWLQE
jgi:hypothetical protein